ncbi:DUF4124 domain-containing protein [Shewanella acanthi]|uniref:DUF4124 domain-containing protein n=1 Tax=Shewanella acanthi TaxID=2864212 RepID=UPI001C657E8B|nr:DUF4124 domain-containing protein [Shewanella acanthi]QYJ79066.1 DUF4124 domain-containing protein [Shewanella acanthi]
MRIFTLLSLLLISLLAQATVYKWVDKDGKVHYSDEPHPKAEVVELNEKTQNQIALPIPSVSNEPTTKAEPIKYQVIITSPQEEETLRDNNGDLDVTVTVTPEIKGKLLFSLKLDGQTIGSPQERPIFHLTNIDRGEHTIVVDAMLQNGKVFASSQPRKIFLHQASVH